MKNPDLKSILKLLTTCFCLAFANLAHGANGYIELGWTSVGSGAFGQNLYMSTQPDGPFKKVYEGPIISVGSSGTKIDGLEAGRTYYFKSTTSTNQDGIRTETKLDTKDAPIKMIAKASSAPPTPLPPPIKSQTSTQPGHLEISGWPVPSGSIAGYSLYMSDTSGKGYKKVNSSPITSTTHTINGIEAGKMYFFTITSLARQDGKLIESRPSQEFSRVAIALPSAEEISFEASLDNVRSQKPSSQNIFFGYGAVSASTRWGTPWIANCDNGQCGTRLKFPAKGASPLDGDGVRLAGHLGMGNGWGQTCSIVSFADIGAKFLPDASPVNLLAKGLPNHGLRLRLKLGPYHPAGHQDYVVMLTRSSITPDPAKNIGSDYVYIVKGSDLKSGAWTEISAPFPREGYAERQPSKFFAQADWIAKSEVHTWGTQDFTFIGFAPVIRDMNFDLSVGGIAFY